MLSLNLLDFTLQFTVSLFTSMAEKEFAGPAVEINKVSFSYNNIKVLDEPTVGLDPELRVTFWQHFAALIKQGVTIIISSRTVKLW